MHAIAGLARLSVADSIRQNDEKLCRVECLAGPEKLASKFRANELCAAASGTMHDEHGIARFALPVFVDLADCPVMNPQLRQRFA